MNTYSISVLATDRPGILFGLTKVLADRTAQITYVDLIPHGERSEVVLEFAMDHPLADVIAELEHVDGVHTVTPTPLMSNIYGKRIIIIGGGAQVGQVALGAISEADRHNIRGERISVDTIPLVGEQPLADAVRAVARLPRASALVLAGALMGGDIERAVREVRAQGLLGTSLNTAGRAPPRGGVGAA